MAAPIYPANWKVDPTVDPVVQVTSVRITQSSTVIQSGHDHNPIATTICTAPEPVEATVAARDPRAVKDLFNASVAGTVTKMVLHEIGPCGDTANSNYYHFLNAKITSHDHGGAWRELSDTNFTITADDYQIADVVTEPVDGWLPGLPVT